SPVGSLYGFSSWASNPAGRKKGKTSSVVFFHRSSVHIFRNRFIEWYQIPYKAAIRQVSLYLPGSGYFPVWWQGYAAMPAHCRDRKSVVEGRDGDRCA